MKASPLITATLLALASVAAAPAASIFSETFTSGTSGWYSTGQLPVSESAGRLNFAPGSGPFSTEFIGADATSSGGAFVGDFTALGNITVSFDLFVASGSTVSTVALDLFNAGTNDEWQFNLAAPTPGVVQRYTITLNTAPPNQAGWTQVAGANSFAFIVANTTDLAIALGGTGTGPTGWIDNVSIAAVPEPGTLTAVLVGLAGCCWGWRRRSV